MKMKKLLIVITLLAVVPTLLLAQTEKALYCADNTTLYFVYDNNSYSAGSTYTPDGETNGITVTKVYTGFLAGRDDQGLWHEYSNITTVDFQNSFAVCRPTSTKNWFYEMTALTSINHIEYLNTNSVTDMSSMFWRCKKLTELDVTHFNTSNVTDMSLMFTDCQVLLSLEVSNFDTRNVTNMSDMFLNCYKVTTLDVSDFDTNKVTDMSSMFSGCNNVTSLDVSKFKTQNVTNMSNMFSNCRKVTTLDVSGFDTNKVTDMSGMFASCFALTSLNVSGFKTENVTKMNTMFLNCQKVTTLDVSHFDTRKVKNMTRMFEGCYNVTSLNVSNFDTRSVTSKYNFDGMFGSCYRLKSLTFGDNFFKANNLAAENFIALGRNLRFVDFSNSTYSATSNAITAVNRSTYGDMFCDVPKTTVIYLPDGSPAPTGSTQNVVYTKDGEKVCDDYYSGDIVDIELPHNFNAKKAQYSRTMSKKYGTVILPYKFKSNDDIQCYTLTQEHTKTMYFEEAETVEAHTPFLFEKKSSGNTASFVMEDENYGITVYATKDTEMDGPYEVTYNNITAQETVSSSVEKTMTWTTKGYYVKQAVADYTNTYYIASDKFYRADGTLALYPHRATFIGSWNYELSGEDAGAPFLNVGIIGADGEEQELTAIESAELFNTVNGISAIFDAQGRRLQQLQPGLNIVHMEDGTVRKVMGK